MAAADFNGDGRMDLAIGSVTWDGGLVRILLNGGLAPNEFPQASAGPDLIVECSSAEGAWVNLDGSRSTDLDSTPGTNDDIREFHWLADFGTPKEVVVAVGESPSIHLPNGSHALTLRVVDSQEATSIDGQFVTVSDTSAPALTALASPAILWPPNHRMIPVSVALEATDLCGETTIELISITNNEPDDEPGGSDGSTEDDIQDVQLSSSDDTVLLRPERSGAGSGRTYSLIYQAVDEIGNAASMSTSVQVPHDQGGSTDPVELRVRENEIGTVVEWNAIQQAQWFNAVRGDLDDLNEVNRSYHLGPVVCLVAGTTILSTAGSEDTETPATGRGFFYLVEYYDTMPSGYGTESAEKERFVPSGQNCP